MTVRIQTLTARLPGLNRFGAAGRVNLYLFLALFASFAAFASGLDNYNTLSRIGLTANFVQHGRLDIEGYADLTADKAMSNGKYYSDKAPGMSFLAMPAAWAFTRVVAVSPDIDVKNPDAAGRKLSMLIYIATLFSSGLSTALAGTMLFAHVRRETESWAAAGVATASYVFATTTWAWATSLFGHAAAGALLIIGFVLVDTLARRSDSKRALLILGAGVALGWAVEIEYTAAIAVAIILGYFGLKKLADGERFMPTAVSVFAIGLVAALMQIPLLAYNNAAFGGPFHLGYSNVVGWAGMKQGIFGIGVPRAEALAGIVFGVYRGVLWLSPVLLIAAGAAIAGAVRMGDRLRGGALMLVILFYFAMNAGYAYWDGGASTGPRHITPLYPFFALALGLWFARASKPWRIGTLALLAVSMLINLAVVSVATMAAPDVKAPLTDLILPSFFAGDLKQSMVQIALGKHGLWQLLPLIVIWAGLGYLIVGEIKQMPAGAAAGPVSPSA